MRISDWSSDVCSSDLLDEAPRAHVRHAAEPQPLERMMNRLALRVAHPRLERHIDIHFHGGGPFASFAGRWAPPCPLITSGARGGRALPPGKTRLSGLPPGLNFPVANHPN